MLKIAFFCPRVRGTVGLRDCAHCRSFREGIRPFSGVIECRQESLVAGYECSLCRAFLPPGALLDAAGHPVCGHCLINGRPELLAKVQAQG
jgi:hypothetical protein